MAGRLDGDLNTETLEVDDGCKNEEGCKEVHDIGQILAVECFMESTLLVWPGKQQVEEGDNGSLEFRATSSIDGSGRESLPDNRLANIGCDEKGDTASKTISLLKKLVQKDDNKASNNQLNDQQNTDTSTKVAGLAVETGKNVDTSLSERQDDCEKLLCGLIEFAIGFEVKVNIDEVGSGKKLRRGYVSLRNNQFGFNDSTSHTWKTMPEEIMGVIPNSIRVPRLLANIMRSQ